jgi:hypothetical protein
MGAGDGFTSTTLIQPLLPINPISTFHSSWPTPETSLAATRPLFVRLYFPRQSSQSCLILFTANPNTSEEAKEHAQEVVDNFESKGEVPETNRSSHTADEKNTGNVIGGHKANLKYVVVSLVAVYRILITRSQEPEHF